MADKERIGFKQFMGLYGMYARMDAAWFLRDTKYCIMGMFADFISNISAISGVLLLAWRFDGVGGMSKYEVLFMLGYVTTVTGIYQLFFSANNVGHISRRIGRGQLDHMLMQPLPMPVQLLVEGFIPVSGSGNMLSGFVVIGIALYNLSMRITFTWFLLLFINLFITMVLIISLSYLFSCITFYAPVAAEEISSYVINLTGTLSNYPLSGMPIVAQVVLITVIPAGLMGWFPACALLGKAPLGFSAFYPFIIAAILAFAASMLFKKGLKHYVKIGSNRYKSMGHR